MICDIHFLYGSAITFPSAICSPFLPINLDSETVDSTNMTVSYEEKLSQCRIFTVEFLTLILYLRSNSSTSREREYGFIRCVQNTTKKNANITTE